MWLLLLTVFVLKCDSNQASDPSWHLLYQSDYDVIPEILEVAFTNATIIGEVKARLFYYNRTQQAINASFHLLIDVTEKVAVTLQVYKMLSNEYRFFPITVSVDLCREFNLNNFGARELLAKTSNITECPAKKGFYTVRNAVIDYSRLFPHITHGRYKNVITFHHGKDLALVLNCYYEIKDKLLKWNW